VDSERTLTAILEHVPVFPLPETVLFPGVVLPLHIFEQRYRDMVADALASHRSIVVAMVKPGAEWLSQPPLCDVACVGRIIHAEKLENGRYNILVQGLERVRLVDELPSSRSYRCFRAEVVPRPTPDAVLEAHTELARLQSCVCSLGAAAAETDKELVEVLRSTADPLELTDILAAVLISEPARQQVVLSAPDLRVRLRQLIDSMAEVMLRYTSQSAVKSN
jgi:Lon protease-like protein